MKPSPAAEVAKFVTLDSDGESTNNFPSMQRHRNASTRRLPVRWPDSASLAVVALAISLALISACATRKPADASPSIPSANATPTPTATPEPAAAEPQPVYRVTVSTEDGGTEQTLIAADGTATPTPTPASGTTPTPAPSASPKPTPGAGNVFSKTWQKIFPPKATPAPSPTPDVIKIKTPREGIFSRLWHSIFPRKKHPPAALPPQWIGTIKLVNEQAGYALIDTQGSMAPPVGDTIRAVGNDMETGSLKISADRNPPFFIADIVSGKPRPGDRVYSPLTP